MVHRGWYRPVEPPWFSRTGARSLGEPLWFGLRLGEVSPRGSDPVPIKWTDAGPVVDRYGAAGEPPRIASGNGLVRPRRPGDASRRPSGRMILSSRCRPGRCPVRRATGVRPNPERGDAANPRDSRRVMTRAQFPRRGDRPTRVPQRATAVRTDSPDDRDSSGEAAGVSCTDPPRFGLGGGPAALATNHRDSRPASVESKQARGILSSRREPRGLGPPRRCPAPGTRLDHPGRGEGLSRPAIRCESR